MDTLNTSFPAANAGWGATEVGWLFTPSSTYQVNQIKTKFSSTNFNTMTLEIYDEPPSAGGHLLRSGSFGANQAQTLVGANISPITFVAGEDYFIGFRNVGGMGTNITNSQGTSLNRLYYGLSNNGTYTIQEVGDFTTYPILQFLGGNTPPSATVSLNTTAPTTNAVLTATATRTDADGDPVSLTYVWKVNGTVLRSVTTSNLTDSFDLSIPGNGDKGQTVTVEVTPNDGQTSGATVTEAATVANSPPTAVGQAVTTPEDTPKPITLAGTDPDGDALTYVFVSGPSHGALQGLMPNLTYTPGPNFFGTDSFTYAVTDGPAGSGLVTVSITVTPVNDAPVGLNDSYSLAEDTTLSVPAPGVLGNDSDVDGNSLTAVLASGPVHGSLTLNPDGSFSYRPADDYFGSDSFNYRPNDGAANGNMASVSLTVTPVNDAPVANPDTATTNEDTTVDIPVLANDSPGPANESDQTLTITRLNGVSVSAGSVVATDHGTVRLNADGTVTYTPAPNYNGADGFTYEITDSGAPPATASTTGSVTINPVNDLPIANDDSYTIAEDGTLTVPAGGILANDTDVDGDTLQVAAPRPLTAPAHGNLTLNADGSFTYVPFANFNGSDSFTYVATDGIASSDPATVRITVTPVNDAPVAVGDAAVTPEDTPVSGNVLTNDTDVDGDPLRLKLGTGPAHGSVTLNSDGSFQYTPAANFNGTDSFTYRANDGSLTSAETTVTITVSPVNDPPVAADDAATTAEDSPVDISVLTNDTDADGDGLSVTAAGPAGHGLVEILLDGQVRYTPNLNFNGTDSFSYTVSDGQGGTAAGTVTVTVTPVNDAPVADAGPGQGASEGSPVTLDGAGSTDVDDTNLTYSWDFGDGTTGTGASVTHSYADNGTYTAKLTVTDPSGLTGTDTTTVTVSNVNPTATFASDGDIDESQFGRFRFTNPTDPSATDTTTGFRFAYSDVLANLPTGYSGPATSTSPAVQFAFGDSGTYTVYGRVFDKDGGYTTYSATITVSNVAPTATLSNDGPVNEGSPATVRFTDAFDPAAQDRDHGFRYAFATDAGALPTTYAAAGASASQPFTFPDDGTYTVYGRIFDKDDGYRDYTTQVTVTNVAPTLALSGAADADEGSEYTLSLSASDPGADTIDHWTINWGDGTAAQAVSGNLATVPHVFDDNGTYTISATATDEDGTWATGNTVTIAVANVAPAVKFTVGTKGGSHEGTELHATAKVFDPSQADRAAGFTLAWSLTKDGSPYNLPPGTVTDANTFVFTPDDNGEFEITVTVTDKDGGVGTQSLTINVDNVAPTAAVTGAPASGPEGTEIALGSTVIDPGTADTQTYAWSVSKDGSSYASGSGPAFSFTPDDNGSYAITLTATDDDGGVGTDTQTIAVTNVAPTATVNAPTSVNEGSPLTVSLTAPIDPSSVDAAALEYAFDTGAGYGAFSATNTASATPADNGTVTVRAQVRDKDGGVTEYTQTITVTNVAPTLALSGAAAVAEGSAYTLNLGTVVDPGADTVSGYTIHWGDGADEAFGGSPSGLTRTHVYANGAAGGTGRTITVDLTDEDGSYFNVGSQSVTVNNVAPTVTLSGPVGAAEGQTKHYTFTASDPGADTLSVSATSGGSVGTVSNLAFDPVTKSGSFDVAFADGPTTSTVSVRVADSDGAASNTSAVDVAVANVNPVIDSLVTPLDPVAAGSPSPVNVSATFHDAGVLDTHTAVWNWGDGTTSDAKLGLGNLTEAGGSGTVTGSHTYLTAGVYTITLTVTDKDGGSTPRTAASYVVVYDPSAGFVTGGGWVNSPAGAYAADPTLTGKATFGFVSKYQKGASTPTGNTQFQFAAAGFEFKSTSYDWLVVAGAKAQYKGSGTVNGAGDYGFLLTAWDGQRTGGGGVDKLRLKVWNKATGVVVYDNQMGVSDGSDPSTALGGGSIQIQDAH